MAKRYPEARFFGLDVSAEMLKTAANAIHRQGLGDQIGLAQGDASDFEPGPLFGVERFERILFSFSLSMIPPWREALDQGARYLTVDGELWVVDFGAQQDLPEWFRVAVYSWLDRFGVHYRKDLAATLLHLSRSLGHEARHVPLFRGYSEMNIMIANGAS